MIKVNINNYDLLQDAYLSDCGMMYQALAVDQDGNDVMLYWNVINYDDAYMVDDTSLDCDWNDAYISSF
jgi:hypothetical protein